MLTALRIGNFKAFAETQRIPVKPLTLIYGANSSGKSSVLHALLLARHAQETGDLDVHRTNVGGESVDLGGFRQYVHHRDVNRRMEWAAELDTASFTGRSFELVPSLKQLTIAFTVGIALDDQGRPVSETVPEIYTYEILADKKSLIRMSKHKNELKFDFVDFEHPIFTNTIDRRFGHLFSRRHTGIDHRGILATAVGKALPNLMVVKGKLLPEKIAFQFEGKKAISSFTPQEFQTFASIRKTPEFSVLQSFIKSLLPEKFDRSLQNDMEFAVRGCLDILSDFLTIVARKFQEELSRLRYLGPLRSYPPRHLAFSQHHDPNWYAGGGYAWDVIRRDPNVRKLVNEWLSAPDRLQTPYRLDVRQLVNAASTEEPLLRKLTEAFQEAGFVIGDSAHEQAQQLISALQNGGYLGVVPEVDLEELARKWAAALPNEMETVRELQLTDLRSNTAVSHRDVGIGVSQALPVLVTAYASRNQIIAIEQPEIHLHPALQADLGDVFIQAALGPGRNRFLIETHSEHLLLRVMRRMRQTFNGELPEGFQPITPEDVAVLFVQPRGSSAVVSCLELDEEGQLLDAWPGGFFEEGYRERFT